MPVFCTVLFKLMVGQKALKAGRETVGCSKSYFGVKSRPKARTCARSKKGTEVRLSADGAEIRCSDDPDEPLVHALLEDGGPEDDRGVGSAANSAAVQLGSALGGAVVGSLLVGTYRDGTARTDARAGTAPPPGRSLTETRRDAPDVPGRPPRRPGT